MSTSHCSSQASVCLEQTAVVGGIHRQNVIHEFFSLAVKEIWAFYWLIVWKFPFISVKVLIHLENWCGKKNIFFSLIFKTKSDGISNISVIVKILMTIFTINSTLLMQFGIEFTINLIHKVFHMVAGSFLCTTKKNFQLFSYKFLKVNYCFRSTIVVLFTNFLNLQWNLPTNFLNNFQKKKKNQLHS